MMGLGLNKDKKKGDGAGMGREARDHSYDFVEILFHM